MAHVKSLEKLTLKEMLFNISFYSGLPGGLIQLPIPDSIIIKGQKIPIPKDMEEFTESLCYGQRIFLARKEDNDFGSILRVSDGYFYPLVTKKEWDENKALLFGKNVLLCRVKEIYPIAMHLVTLVGEMAEREQKLLHREPSKLEKAAGIDKLSVFSELTAIDFLRQVLNKTYDEVMLTSYNECLVRFMLAHETAMFQERHYELMKRESESKTKYK